MATTQYCCTIYITNGEHVHMSGVVNKNVNNTPPPGPVPVCVLVKCHKPAQITDLRAHTHVRTHTHRTIIVISRK